MWKVAIIGFGKFGLKRLKACLDLKDKILVVGIADTDQTARELATNNFGLKSYDNHKDLILATRPDFVIISTPPKFHKKIVLDCIRANTHVLCEKPLCTSSEDALTIDVASKKYKKFVKLGSNHRFFISVDYALNLLKHKKIGEVLNVRATIGNNGSLSQNSWFWNHDYAGGGTLIDNGSHVIDLIRQILGDFEYCFGHMDKSFWKKAKVEDHATAVFITRDNKEAIITSSWAKWYGYLNIEVWGDKGFIFINSDDKDFVTIGNGNNGCGSIKKIDFSNELHDSNHQEILYFIKCIEKNKQPNPNAFDAYKILKMIEAAYKSDLEKRIVKI